MLKSGDGAIQLTSDSKERIGRMLQMHANKRRRSTRSPPATSSPLVGPQDTTTGDTLCDPSKPDLLERMEFPEPVIEVAIEPKTKADQEKLAVALQQARRRGPVVPRQNRPETGQTMIRAWASCTSRSSSTA